MGQKSDAEILQSLADFKSGNATDTDEPEVDGVGDMIPDEGGDKDDDETDEAPDSEDSAGDDGDAEEPGDEAEESDDAEPDTEPDKDKPDDSADKEIARIQEATKEAQQRLDEKIAELKSGEDERDARLAKAEAIEAKNEKTAKRAKQAPIAFAKSAGLETHQDFLDFGAKIYKYGKSLDPEAKPELKAWARGEERDGEQDSSVTSLEAKVAALEAKLEAGEKKEIDDAESSKQQAEAIVELNTFADLVIKECSGEYPMAARAIGGLDEAEARENIIDLARHLFLQDKKPPTTRQIFEAIEANERKVLKRLGLDPDELFPRTKSKDKPVKASKKTKAPKNSSNKPKPKVQTDEEIVAKLKQRREERQNA